MKFSTEEDVLYLNGDFGSLYYFPSNLNESLTPEKMIGIWERFENEYKSEDEIPLNSLIYLLHKHGASIIGAQTWHVVLEMLYLLDRCSGLDGFRQRLVHKEEPMKRIRRIVKQLQKNSTEGEKKTIELYETIQPLISELEIVYILIKNKFDIKFIDKTERYLFNWDEILGNNKRLIEFLKQNFCIDWVKTAKIEKIDEGKAIQVSSEKKSLSIRLNDEKTKVMLTINGDGTYGFIVKTENSKQNIYDEIRPDIEFIKNGYMADLKYAIPYNFSSLPNQSFYLHEIIKKDFLITSRKYCRGKDLKKSDILIINCKNLYFQNIFLRLTPQSPGFEPDYVAMPIQDAIKKAFGIVNSGEKAIVLLSIMETPERDVQALVLPLSQVSSVKYPEPIRVHESKTN